MNEQLVVTKVHPMARDEEIAAITTALAALWAKPTMRQGTDVNRYWRFSGRMNQQRRVSISKLL